MLDTKLSKVTVTTEFAEFSTKSEFDELTSMEKYKKYKCNLINSEFDQLSTNANIFLKLFPSDLPEKTTAELFAQFCFGLFG